MFLLEPTQNYTIAAKSHPVISVDTNYEKLQALIIQASLPVLFIFPPIIIYGLYHLEFINFTIIEYLVYVLFRLATFEKKNLSRTFPYPTVSFTVMAPAL